MSTKVLAGRYELIERIGTGGMAVVYKARCRLLNRFVAIKILKPEFTKDVKFIENFRRESQSAASLNHPNIVNTYDVGREGNIHYIVMELIEGESLSDKIRREGKLDYKTSIDITRQIASALSFAHKHQIIHRDVKPHNIMITQGGTAKITDFGIAKAVNASTLIGNTGTVMGSVHYFSPEQARGEYVDERSDIYSLGIVLYEMLTGTVPYDGDNPVAVALMHINDPMPLPSSRVSGIPPRLEQIVCKATDKFSVNRYKNADEMVEALDSLEFIERVIGKHSIMPEQPAAEGGGRLVQVENTGSMERDGEDHTGKGEKRQNTGNTQKSGKPKKKIRLNKKRIAVIIAALVAAVPLSFLLAHLIGNVGSGSVSVPGFQNMTLAEAQTTAAELGLNVEVADYVLSDNVEEGHIVSQNPEEKTGVKPGKTIMVNVSRGTKDGTVPKIVGSLQKEAVDTIEKYNYKVGTITPKKSSLPEGTVLNQSPEAGIEAAVGTYIDFTVSEGKDANEAIVPLLLGMTQEEAAAALKEAGLTLGEVTEGESDAYDPGQVMWQEFSAESVLNTEEAVAVKIVSEDTGYDGNVQFAVSYDMAASDIFYLSVILVDDGGTHTIMSNQQRQKSDGGEIVLLSGEGIGTVTVIMDDVVVSKRQIDFSTGTMLE